MMDPPRLLDGTLGVTERQLLEAARREEPDEALAQKMLAPLGLVVPPAIYSGSEAVEGTGQTFVPQATTGQGAASTGSAAVASLPPAAPLLLGGATKWVGSALLIGIFGGASLWGASKLLAGGVREAEAPVAPLGGVPSPGLEEAEESTALHRGVPASGKLSPTSQRDDAGMAPPAGGSVEGSDALVTGAQTEPGPADSALSDRSSGVAHSGSVDSGPVNSGPVNSGPVDFGRGVSTGTREAGSWSASGKTIPAERRPAEEAFESTVIAEIGILGEVRLQLHEGKPGRALGLLADYRRQFPTGKLVPESRLLEARARQQLEQARQVGDQPSP